MTTVEVRDGSNAAALMKHVETENARDTEAMLATLIDDDPVRDEVTGKTYRGAEEVAARYEELWQAFPDFHAEPTLFVEEGDTVVMEADFTGTHRGVYDGHMPTGKSFNLRVVGVFRFNGGKIAMESIYFDRAAMFEQLGLTKT
ncbi:MAG: ester cyclase [Alphaproteobacteria bacterium]|nr:ester cyclase [Alphaproteobacteria bacterium]